MNQSLLYQLTASLNKLRGSSARSLERLRDALVSLEYGGDAGDQGRTLIDRRSFVDGIVSANARIERIDGALARVRDGSFGTCMGCGEEIPERRLRAQPWSEGCICCQETREMPFVAAATSFQGDTARLA